MVAMQGCTRTPSTEHAPTNASEDASTPRLAPVRFSEHHDDALAAFRQHPGFLGHYRLQEIMGSGAALFDFDNDDRLDIYLVDGAPGNEGKRADLLLRQREDGSFENLTETSGITPHGFGMGATTGDYDNDGDLDLVLTGVGQLQLFRNDGDGTFSDVSAVVGLSDQPWCVAAAFADLDADNWLDLVVVNYVLPDDSQRCFDKSGRQEFCGPQHYQPLADVIYRNEQGTFHDVSHAAGLDSKRGPGLGVMCIDFTGDALVDIYVANDAAANFLWVNQGDGTFIERAAQLGGAYNREGAAEASMGVTVGDINGDNELDLFMTHLDSESNTLYRIANGSFSDVTALTGLGPPSLPVTGFGTAMLDADLDGDLDIVVVNGAIKRRQSPFAHAVGIEGLRPYAEPRQLYVNDGSGRFEMFSGDEAGLGPIEVGRGLAVGDVNRDGALDLLVTSAGSSVRLLLGERAQDRHWLAVRAVDGESGRDQLGSVVTIRVGTKRFMRHILASYSYASSNEPIAHFGLGAARDVDDIIMQWPDGTRERFPGGPADRRLTLIRGMGEPAGEKPDIN